MSEMWEYIKNNLDGKTNSIIKEYDGHKEYVYSDLLDKIENIGNNEQIQTLKGAKCVILCRESIETVKGLFLCWYADMIAIPLSLNYGKEHCESIIKATKPDAIISDDLKLCEGFEIIISIVEGVIYRHSDIKIKYEEELKNVDIMLGTSGTTGTPKVIMFSGKALQHNVNLICSYFPVKSNDTILICRPLYHCAVLVGELLLALQVGANIIFYSGGFEPLIIANLLKECEITVMCGTPTIFMGVASYLKHRNTKGRLRIIALSGESLLIEYAQNIRESFPEAKIYNVYGLTEAGPRVSFLPYDMFDSIPQAVGYPLPGVEIKIVDKENRELSCNELGDVWIKTPTIMLGYYKEERKTLSSFHDRWFKTGDVGKFDENGCLYILGRNDNMIIKAGMNIYPQEVERIIAKLDEVKEVLVYGRLIMNIEHIMADVVLQEEYIHETSWNLMHKVAQILPPYMMLRSIHIVENLPKNASGKLIRPVARVKNI